MSTMGMAGFDFVDRNGTTPSLCRPASPCYPSESCHRPRTDLVSTLPRPSQAIVMVMPVDQPNSCTLARQASTVETQVVSVTSRRAITDVRNTNPAEQALVTPIWSTSARAARLFICRSNFIPTHSASPGCRSRTPKNSGLRDDPDQKCTAGVKADTPGVMSDHDRQVARRADGQTRTGERKNREVVNMWCVTANIGHPHTLHTVSSAPGYRGRTIVSCPSER